ncbi:MAG TPA: hypothetical protein VL945_00555, partial [Candidatus Saccharimonadales bacterium]|nr:hypothetical protein [Candidatus Saccharimonadales bacterium]
LNPAICYMAGLQSKGNEERSAVGVSTGLESIEQKFIEIAVKDLGIEPNRIIIEEIGGGMRHVFFYHSRICRQLKDICEKSDKMFRRRNELSSAYVAGMFDAAGHKDSQGLYMKKIGPKDAVLLQNLEVYTKGNRIMNMTSFMKLIAGFSLLLGTMRMKGR